jgi:O-antigen ligase
MMMHLRTTVRDRWAALMFVAVPMVAVVLVVHPSLPAPLSASRLVAGAGMLAFLAIGCRYRVLPLPLRTVGAPATLAIIALFLAVFSELVLGETSIRSLAELEASPLSAANLTRAALLVTGAVVVGVSTLRNGHFRWPSLDNPVSWLAAFVVAGFVSTFGASNQFVSTLKLFELAATVVVASGVVHLAFGAGPARAWSAERVRGLVASVFVLITVRLILYWFMAALNPAEAFRPSVGVFGFQLGGLFYAGLHPNTLGQLGAFLVVVGGTVLSGGRVAITRAEALWLFLGVSVGAVTLVLAQARTSLLAAVVAMLVLLLARRPQLLTWWIMVALAFGASTQVPALMDYVYRGQSGDLFLSLSGRTTYWAAAADMVGERPLLGYGYYTGARFDLSAEYGRFEVSTVDNTFLEVLLTMGMLGLAPLVLFLLTLLLPAIRGLRAASAELRLAAEVATVTMIVLLFRAAAGPSIQVLHPSYLLLLVPLAYWRLHCRVRATASS